jgi:hypothetical protein
MATASAATPIAIAALSAIGQPRLAPQERRTHRDARENSE